MFQQGCAEVPGAAIWPERTTDGAAQLPEELARLFIFDSLFIRRDFFAQRMNIKDVIICKVGVAVDAADGCAVGTYGRCRRLNEWVYFFDQV